MLVAKYFMVVVFVGSLFLWGVVVGSKLNLGKSGVLEAPCSAIVYNSKTQFLVDPLTKTCFYGYHHNRKTTVDCKTVLLLEEFSDVRHCFP